MVGPADGFGECGGVGFVGSTKGQFETEGGGGVFVFRGGGHARGVF